LDRARVERFWREIFSPNHYAYRAPMYSVDARWE
jgi:hypothetical protein